jgi:small subunit ribosomal protein S20
MAHHKSAIKRIKTSKADNLRNRRNRALMRSALRQVIEAAKPEDAGQNLRKAYSVLDRLVSKGIIHRRTADRRKALAARRTAAIAGQAKAEALSQTIKTPDSLGLRG